MLSRPTFPYSNLLRTAHSCVVPYTRDPRELFGNPSLKTQMLTRMPNRFA